MVDASLTSPRTLREVVRSVSSGAVTSRSPQGQFPLYGSTGQIGWTEEGIYSGSSVLVARVGANAGYVYSVDGRYGVTDNTLIVRPDTTTDPLFIAYYLDFLKLNSMVYGSGQPLITGRILKALEFPGMTQIEQSQVATALQHADALILALERLIAKKQAIKQGIMQQLLTGKTRLRGFSGDWVTVTAGEISLFKGGSGFPLKYQGKSEGEYPFFKVSDMNNTGNELVMRRANNYISEAARKRMGAVVMPKGAIVFAKVGAAVFLERKRILEHPSCLDNNMAAMIVDISRADVRFIHYLLMNFSLSSLVATTALPSLNSGQLRSIPLRMPSEVAEQRAIAAQLGDIDEELGLLGAKLSKLRNIKQGMMQELLTGRTRLVPAEVAA